jgi:hypothetical protein
MPILKEYLLNIAHQIDDNTTIEDVYKLLALFEDIDISEEQISQGQTLSQKEVEIIAKSWLK